MKYSKLNKLELNNLQLQFELSDKNYFIVENMDYSKSLWIHEDFDKFTTKQIVELIQNHNIDKVYISEIEANMNIDSFNGFKFLFVNTVELYAYRLFGKGSSLFGIKYNLNSNELENPLKLQKVIGIAYHSADTDGLMSQYIIRKCINHMYPVLDDVRIVYIPYNYSKEDNQYLFESIFMVNELYILDFTPNKNIMDNIEDMIKVKPSFNVTIIDHHNDENLIYVFSTFTRNENITIYSNFEKSACQLCLEYYSGLFANSGKKLPFEYQNIKQFVDYFDYHDTWKYGSNNVTDLISQYLQFFFHEKVFSITDRTQQRLAFNNYLNGDSNISSKDLYRVYSNIGANYYLEAELEYDKKPLKALEFEDCNFYFQEGKSSYFSWKMLLSNTMKPSITFHYQIDGENAKISVRSNKYCESVNAQKFAKYFCGGGHPHAAGFTLQNCTEKNLPFIIMEAIINGLNV